jgi:hypothetical protein
MGSEGEIRGNSWIFGIFRWKGELGMWLAEMSNGQALMPKDCSNEQIPKTCLGLTIVAARKVCLEMVLTREIREEFALRCATGGLSGSEEVAGFVGHAGFSVTLECDLSVIEMYYQTSLEYCKANFFGSSLFSVE